MKTPRLTALIVVIGLGSPSFATEPLPRSSPEAQGVSSAAVLAFVEAADKNIDVDEQLHARAPRPRRRGRLVGAVSTPSRRTRFIR